MFELLTVILFVWLMIKAIGLAFRLTWGAARIAASVLMALAVPVLVLCFLFAGGVMLLVPLVVVGTAVGILKACM